MASTANGLLFASPDCPAVECFSWAFWPPPCRRLFNHIRAGRLLGPGHIANKYKL
jgi:hypothetical protein